MTKYFSAIVFIVFIGCNRLLAQEPERLLDLSNNAKDIGSYFDGNKNHRSIKVDSFRVSMDGKDELRPFTVRLGKIPESSTTEFSIPIENATDSVVKLAKLDSSCGCVAALNNELVLKPGDSDSMVIRVVAPRESLAFKRTVVARFSTGLDEEIAQEINISGESEQFFSLATTIVDLAVLKKSKQDSVELLLFPNFGQLDLRDYAINASSRLIKEIEVFSHKEKSARIKVTFDDFEDAPFDEWQERLEVTRKDGQVFTVPFTLTRRGKFYVKPSKVSLEKSALEDGARFVVAASDKKETVKILKTQLSFRGAVLEDSHHLENVLAVKHLSAFRLKFDKLPQGFLAGNEATLFVYVEGQTAPLLVPILVSE